MLTPPETGDFNVPTLTTEIRPFAESANEIAGCAPIYYNLLVPDLSFSANFKIDVTNEIRITPDESNPLGTYTFQIEACVQPALPSNPVCELGPGFEVQIWDLCTANEILSRPLPGTMASPQEQFNVMPVGDKWLTKYPDVDCGGLEYKVLQNGLPVDDWVVMDDNY